MAERTPKSFLSSTITNQDVFIHWRQDRLSQRATAQTVYSWSFFKVLAVDEVLGFLHLEGRNESRDVPYTGRRDVTEIVHLDDVERISIKKR